MSSVCLLSWTWNWHHRAAKWPFWPRPRDGYFFLRAAYVQATLAGSHSVRMFLSLLKKTTKLRWYRKEQSIRNCFLVQTPCSVTNISYSTVHLTAHCITPCNIYDSLKKMTVCRRIFNVWWLSAPTLLTNTTCFLNTFNVKQQHLDIFRVDLK